MTTTGEQSLRISRTSLTQWWLLLMMMCTLTLSEAPFTDFLDWHCDEYISLSHFPTGSIKLQLTFHDKYSPNTDCQVTFQVRDGMRISMTFQYMDVQCLGDYLQVYGGYYKAGITEDVMDGKKFCGNQTPAELTSSHSNLTLRFVSDSDMNGRGFAVQLTAFHDGECSESGEFRCGNRRCINSDLYCDDVDNCGDGSDLCHVVVYVVVCTVLLSVLLMVAALTLTAVLWYRWKRRIHYVNEEQATSLGHTDYIFTITEGAHVVSMYLSQLMPTGPQTFNWTIRPARVT